MCKEGCCVGLGQLGVAWAWGELFEIPEKGVKQEKGEGKEKIFKMRGKLGQGVGALKRGGLEPP